MATKKIKLPKDNQGNEYYPATTTDAVVHPVKRKSMTAIIDESEKKADEHGNAINEINETLPNKVDRTDNAPELTSGFAGNLVGRGEATSEEIGFRPSGGLTSVNDGAARIERLKGNTVVWNQLADTPKFKASGSAVNNITVVNDGKKVTVTNMAYEGTGGDAIAVIMSSKKTAIGHKILVSVNATFSNSAQYVLFEYGYYTIEIRDKNNNGSYEAIYTTDRENTALLCKAGGTKAIGDTWSFSNIQVHDLTQMFGAGNEPTTIEEFNARKPLGIDEYAYNEGELISTTADEIKSVGFNAWDEEWEIGSIINGEDNPYSGHFRSKNYIPVLPNTDYFFKSNGTLFLSWYDEEYNYIPLGNLSASNGVKKSPENARYLRFYAYNETTYNHDICINLVHTGYRNGEYEPYEEFRRSLPISEIKDSEGNALFPNGLLSAGEVYDEITDTKAIKRIGMVDMGTLSWLYETTYSSFNLYADVSKYGFAGELNDTSKPNILNTLYATSTRVGSDKDVDKTIKMYYASTLRIKDTSYTDTATFKTAMSGVMLYYELAEPIEVDLPEPLNLDYEVSDFGTEEVISDTPTTPLKADIIYQFNAVDRIRENSANIKKIEDKLDDISVDLLTPITYSSLKALRDGGSLVKGMWYRITDYVTTTVQSQTKSANHPFDVIVLATSESELSHLARAIAHEGDTYFDSNDLGAWELWYDLDNDTTKYEWADATNGKGVIYRMIDEKRNDCPYDFKNMLFYNDKYTSSTTSDKYYYTFSCVKNVLYDGTVEKRVTNCYGNSMGVYINSEKRSLNSNVWRNTYFDDHCYSNTFGSNCHNNTFGYSCHSNTFGSNCHNNTFGNSCHSNTFGSDCYSNTFGSDCHSNTLGCDCYGITFGSNCHNNTFGNSCYSNTFGRDCSNNTFGYFCPNNAFGNTFYSNTFGDYCFNNRLGSGSYNTFGSDCSSNKFGYLCSNNTFGNSLHSREVNADKTSITLNDEYYDDGSGQLVPVKHPDLSTQPSILPYKFMGNYVYEQLTPTSAMTAELDDKLILSAEAVGVGRVKAIGVTCENGVLITSEDVSGYKWIRIVYTSMSEENSGYYGYNNY